MQILTNENNQSIIGNPGESSYFLGRFKAYGQYQWNMKYYDWENECEIEIARYWGFGDRVGNTYSEINELLGREVSAWFDGRSGGWFVIDSELTEEELIKVNDRITAIMEYLPTLLKEEREFLAG
jgi:hypothetical protein